MIALVTRALIELNYGFMRLGIGLGLGQCEREKSLRELAHVRLGSTG
jgi:hypothetical protein